MKINRRGGFSDRNGIKPLNREVQLRSLDEHTRTAIANMIHRLFNHVFNDLQNYEILKEGSIQDFVEFVYSKLYSVVVPQSGVADLAQFWKIVDSTVLKEDYDDVLTLVEGIAQYLNQSYQKTFNVFNVLFEEEYVGYRFIGDILSPISNEIEVQEITNALESPFSATTAHIAKANSLLSNRQNPDYANSIKESICAVEALCKIVTNEHGASATLGKMIKKLSERGINIQPALSAAFEKLYGYTSGANGIRHAGDIGGPDSTFEEARFMLVICSAFINYVKGNLAKIDGGQQRG